MTDDVFLKLANAVNDSYKREVEWLKAANDLQRKQILELELEIARLRGRNQGLEMLAVDNYPLGERPELPPRFTASLSPPGRFRTR
jgi:hypothetical protein